MAGDERSEAATPRRRSEARRRGQVPKSNEVVSAVGILVAFALLQWAAPTALAEMGESMRQTYRQLPREDITPARVAQYGLAGATTLARAVGPLALGVLVCGVAVNVVQTGLLFSCHALKPDPQRINPLRGLSRMVSTRTWFDLGKTVVKVSACGIVLCLVGVERQNDLLALGGVSNSAALGVLADVAMEMGFKVGALLAVAAVLDYGYQRFEYERNLRMSRQELKEEMRSTEGDPHTRSRIRSQQRTWAQRRMMQAVPKADVVVTNPTHLAVALQYEPHRMGAPRVVAKGELLMAERIIALAKEHKVAIVHNVPLAHALYRTVEVGKEIPATLYKAVAEVLAFVYRLRVERRA
jgi:flagellar biosynthetic protein FlhB